ncbi:MAG: iron-containing alcohol dehydrogenase [Bacteroidetes bacterium]|nr:iron-containing alcohol dehydrogenase [Bacteroidota bacterium]
MINFEYHNPTKIVFGKDQYNRLPELIKSVTTGKNILITYGGGSIFKNGIYDKAIAHLSEFEIVEFGGIEANPEFDTLMKAVEICRTQKIDFILAIGGGSVIDGTKFICGATHYASDPWEVLERKPGCAFEKAIPFGSILTLPATGSEANSGAVISRSSLKTKRTMGGPNFFPAFSICDPTAVASLPKRQIANGIVDAFVHTLEQYLTYPTDNLLQERQAEAILSTLIEIGPKVMENPANYELAANLMWCATHALNGNLRCGVPTDWATHMIGHELTALFGIDHARTLAIIGPRLFENQFEIKKEKLTQYGKRVWNLSGDENQIAKAAIEKTESFYQSLGIETRLGDYTSEHQATGQLIKDRFEEREWLRMGEKQSITPEVAKNIVIASI